MRRCAAPRHNSASVHLTNSSFMLARAGRGVTPRRRSAHSTASTVTAARESVREARLLQESVRRGFVGHLKHLLETKRPAEVKKLVNSWTDTGFKPIHVAVVWNESESLRFLISHSARINARSDNDETALLLAAQRGQLGLVKQLLASGEADPNLACGTNLTTPLHEAALHNRPEVVRALIESGSAPDQMSKEGWSALQYAADRGHHLCIVALLEGGAQPDLHLHTNSSPSPLYLASAKGHLNAMQALLCAGANPNFSLPETRETPLLAAAKLGHEKAVKLLLERNADPSAVDAQGFNALHYAARRGNGDIVAQLLSKGVRCDQRAVDGSTALHLAAALGHKGVCTMLLTRGGASVHFKNEDGDTPLHLACKKNQMEIVSLLLAHKSSVISLNATGLASVHLACQSSNIYIVKSLLTADLSAASLRSSSGDFPLHFSARAGTAKVAAMLFYLGATPAVRSSDGLTPLQLAASEGHLEFVKFLLSRGTIPDLDPPHATPSALQLALRGKHDAVAKVLLVNGSNPNRAADSLSHPIFLALEFTNNAILTTLLSMGADPNVRNARGQTPLMVATELGKRDAITALLNAGARREDKSPEGLTALQIALQNYKKEDIIGQLSMPPPARKKKRPEPDVEKLLQSILRKSK